MNQNDGHTSESEPLNNLASAGQSAFNVASDVMRNKPSGKKTAEGKDAHTAGNNNKQPSSAYKGADEAKKAQEAADGAKKAAENAKKAGEAAKNGAEAAKLGAEAGTAAATGGMSLVPQAAADVASKTIGAAGDMLSGNDDGNMSIGKLIMIMFLTIFLFAFCAGYYNTNNSSSQVENHEEVEYTNDENGIDKSKRNDVYVNNDDDAISDGSNREKPYRPAIEKYKEETDKALDQAFMEQARKIVEALGKRDSFVSKFRDLINKLFGDGFSYNEEKTKNTFWDNPYPYCMKISLGGQYYSIGDYLKTKGYTNADDHYYHEGNYKIIPDCDMNYAEVNVVMSQGSNYQTHGGTFNSYIDLFNTPDNQKLMFEMTVEGMHPWYYGYENEYQDGRLVRKIYHGEFADPDEAELKLCDEKYFYYKVIVKPFGLREMYKIAGVEDELTEDDTQPGNQASFNHPSILNYEFLDMSEKYDRVYCRMNENEEDFMGPSYYEERDRRSFIYGEQHTIDKKPLHTGRSANWYIPLNEMINVDDLRDLINGKITAEELQNRDFGEDAVVPIHNFSGNESAFLEEIKAAVMKDMSKTGILASLTAAQALLESGHGTSGLTKKANALFGIKGSYQGMSVTMMTREEVNGQVIKVPAQFRAYNSWDESISDHSGLFLRNQKRYGNLIGETDYKQACYNVKADGYATDSGYAGKLISIIEAYHLDEWDKAVLSGSY